LTAGVLTIVLSLALKIFAPTLPFQNRTGIVFWTCIIAHIAVSLLTKPPSPESLNGLIWTKESLHLPASDRGQSRGIRNPALWWAGITLVVLYFYVRYA